MEFFILLIIGIIALNLLVPKPKPTDSRDVIYRTRRCPPHKWKWQEIRDKDTNELITHKMICEWCGPLRSSQHEAD